MITNANEKPPNSLENETGASEAAYVAALFKDSEAIKSCPVLVDNPVIKPTDIDPETHCKGCRYHIEENAAPEYFNCALIAASVAAKQHEATGKTFFSVRKLSKTLGLRDNIVSDALSTGLNKVFQAISFDPALKDLKDDVAELWKIKFNDLLEPEDNDSNE